MKRVFSLLLVLALTLSLAACGDSSAKWQEQYDLGQKYLTEGSYEEAILAFTAAIEIDPKRALAYVGRGRAYIASGATEDNLAAAQADFETAIDLDDSLAEAYLGLAEVYVVRGESERAQDLLESALDKTDSDQRIAEKLVELVRSTSQTREDEEWAEGPYALPAEGETEWTSTYDADGKLLHYIVWTLDEYWNRVGGTYYAGDGTLLAQAENTADSRVSYDYKSGEMLRWVDEGVTKSGSQEVYRSGIYGLDGRYLGYREITYDKGDANGNAQWDYFLHERFYDPDGTMEYQSMGWKPVWGQYYYANDYAQMPQTYAIQDGNGVTIGYEVWDQDAFKAVYPDVLFSQLPVLCRIYQEIRDADGNLLRYVNGGLFDASLH